MELGILDDSKSSCTAGELTAGVWGGIGDEAPSAMGSRVREKVDVLGVMEGAAEVTRCVGTCPSRIDCLRACG